MNGTHSISCTSPKYGTYIKGGVVNINIYVALTSHMHSAPVPFLFLLFVLVLCLAFLHTQHTTCYTDIAFK